jgi:hypothetical protein
VHEGGREEVRIQADVEACDQVGETGDREVDQDSYNRPTT